MPWWQILLCVLYVLSPLDFIPDVVPFFGWLDDIGVLAFLIQSLREHKASGTNGQVIEGRALTGPS